MLQSINILNQATAVAQIFRAPAWSIESVNFHRYGYTVRLNPELQVNRVGSSLVGPNVPQQMSSNPVLYPAVPPYVVPLSNSSPPLTAVHGLDNHKDITLLQFPSSDDAFAVRTFTEHLIETGRIDDYATDKRGSRFLQKVFVSGDMPIRQKLTDHFLKMDIFIKLCDDIFANFFLQKLIEEARSNEQATICSLLETNMVTFSHGRYSCRVVQKAFECFDVTNCLSLIGKLDGAEKDLSLDQNGNHVIQKIFSCVPFYGYSGIVSKYVASTDILNEVMKDRYGCRVIQLSIEKLEEEVTKNSKSATSLLEQLVSMILKDCWSYSADQYANYVIQHIIISNTLEKYRNTIICELLSNLLSMSQEKYASHVVEKALKYAPPKLLHAMMDEIFDGYECDTKGHDALDVLLFDQFGNYVIQTMLDIAVEAKEKKRVGNDSWFKRLAERIIKSQHKLIRYSSGKKILEKLSAAVSDDKDIIQDENFDPALKSLIVPKKFR
uniref:PUM-HD domain-containing protein n=1 Tax=Wuchereria bancrofti TaxID=6293 RepID=A0A1I8F095_WUCBA